MNTIGQSIRAARLAALLSQQELAEKAGIGNSQLSRYENDGSTPPLQIAIFLADALGITLDELVGHNGYDPNASRGACTIGRIDVNGNYEPSNCRWVSMSEQALNKRR